MNLPHAPDVLVVGGGVIGCAVARALAQPGRSVVLADRGAFGGEATTAAAGVLAVASGDDEDVRLALRRTSLARYPPLAAALADETGIDIGFERAGVLELCLGPTDTVARARFERRRVQGFAVEWLDSPRVRALAPAANATAEGGAVFTDDARVTPARLVEALATSARRRGVVLAPGVEVSALERRGDRITGASVGGKRIEPHTVVVAAGAWSSRLSGLPLPLDVVPARGQMLALRTPGLAGGPTLQHAGAYLVQRPGGEAWIGATVERAGFVRAVTPAGVVELLEHLRRIAPAARAWPIVRMWAGLRPEAPAGGPRIGRHPALENVLVATGHHRNGILLAPITAELIAADLDGTAAPADAAAFAVG